MIETIQEQKEREEKERESIEQDEKCRQGKHVPIRSNSRGTFCEHCDHAL